MTDQKISALDPISLPLQLTDVLPWVRAGANYKSTLGDVLNLLHASPFAVVGNATAGAEIRLPEDTDNGSNYVGFKAPDSLAANVVYTLPSADGANGQALVTNGSKVLSWATIGAAAPLTLASGTLTDPSTALAITQTWNDGADAFKAMTIGVTATAAADGSRVLDALIGGTSVFSIDKDGYLRGKPNGLFSADTIYLKDNVAMGSIGVMGAVGAGYNFAWEFAAQMKAIYGAGVLMGWASVSSESAENLRSNLDSTFARIAAGVIGVRGTSTSVGGALNFLEQTAPSAPGANQAVVYAEDNGSGKTRLMVRFPSGAAQVLSTEP